MCVHDGDVVLVPRGYHPVGAAHGYDLYYLNVMAGPHRAWVIHNDPEHEWMLTP
jgi:5-deoxy-glucuronate isomerase